MRPGNSPCHLANRWNPIRDNVLQFLRETSAADLAVQMRYHRRYERALLVDMETGCEQQVS